MKTSLREAIEKGAQVEELDEAVILVQDVLGVTDCDAADVFFNGDQIPEDARGVWKMLDHDRRTAWLVNYTKAELPFLLTYEDQKRA